MASTDPITGATIQDQGDFALAGQHLGALLLALRTQVLPKFSNITARNAAYSAAGITPSAGLSCTVGGVVHTHDGTTWRWLRKGFIDVSTGTDGSVTLPHGLGAAPTGAFVTPGPQYSDLLNRIISMSITATDSANIQVFCKRTDTSATLPSQQVRFSWEAFV